MGSLGAQISIYGGGSLALIGKIYFYCKGRDRNIPPPSIPKAPLPHVRRARPRQTRNVNHVVNTYKYEKELYNALLAYLAGNEAVVLIEHRHQVAVPLKWLSLLDVCFQDRNILKIKERIARAISRYKRIFVKLDPSVRKWLLISIFIKLNKRDPSLKIFRKENADINSPFQSGRSRVEHLNQD